MTQKDKFVSTKEGEPIQLNCSYTGSEYSLQWYKQRLDGQLQFIELLFQTGTKSGDHFSMTLDKEKKSTFLYLNSARLEDSAVYFCALSHSVTRLHLACYETYCGNPQSSTEVLFSRLNQEECRGQIYACFLDGLYGVNT